MGSTCPATCVAPGLWFILAADLGSVYSIHVFLVRKLRLGRLHDCVVHRIGSRSGSRLDITQNSMT